MDGVSIWIMGPTASGKTDLALALADQLPVEIISVDSALIYRHMNIGTAKPSPDILARYPHHLVDIIEPEQTYSVALFCQQTRSLMQSAIKKGRIPLLVGGTMMYFNALQFGLSELPAADPKLRSALNQRLNKQGLKSLYDELNQIDPNSAARLHPNDKQRILRALEVFHISGRPMSQYHQHDRLPWQKKVLKFAPMYSERTQLHQNIAIRFEKMLAQGFEQEVRSLLSRPGMSPDLPSMRAVGYRQMIAYIQGRWNRNTMIEKAIIATRQLAKRQLTWLRREKDLNWLIDQNPEQSSRLILDRLKSFSL